MNGNGLGGLPLHVENAGHPEFWGHSVGGIGLLGCCEQQRIGAFCRNGAWKEPTRESDEATSVTWPPPYRGPR